MSQVTPDKSLLSPDAMPPWQLERRQRIVHAALELLEQSDYNKIQIRDVAERSGFALGTIYRYFKSKEHLYAAVMVEWSHDFQNQVRRRPLPGGPPDRLKAIIRRVVRAFERRPQFLRVELMLENTLDEFARATYEEAGMGNISGFLAALPDLPQDIAAQIVEVVASVLGTQLNQFAVGRVSIERVERIANEAVDLIFSPPPGAIGTEP